MWRFSSLRETHQPFLRGVSRPPVQLPCAIGLCRVIRDLNVAEASHVVEKLTKRKQFLD